MSGPGQAQTQSARAALAALVAGAALAFTAGRPVLLLIAVAIAQVAFVLAWVLGVSVAVAGSSLALASGSAEPDGPQTDRHADGDATGPNATALDSTGLDSTGVDAVDQRDGAMPGRIGAVLIGLGAAAATDAAVMHWPHSALSAMLGILGLAVPVMFAHQLIRGVVRARVVESLSGIAMIIASVLALPALIQLRHEVGGGHLVAATAVASALAVVLGLFLDLVWSRPRFDPQVPRGLTGVVLSAVAGGVVGAYPLRHQEQFSTVHAIAYCVGIALISALISVATSMVGHNASSPLPGRVRSLRPLAFGLLPIMLVSPAAYVLLVSA